MGQRWFWIQLFLELIIFWLCKCMRRVSTIKYKEKKIYMFTINKNASVLKFNMFFYSMIWFVPATKLTVNSKFERKVCRESGPIWIIWTSRNRSRWPKSADRCVLCLTAFRRLMIFSGKTIFFPFILSSYER